MLQSVRDRSLAIATFRHLCVRLMETVAGWTPTTPEMEVKLLFGRQIWDFAQMADALGKRAFEMRQPLHFTRPPVAAYDQVLDDLSRLSSSADRVLALVGVQRGLQDRVLRHQAELDDILDQPSIVILESMARELARQQNDGSKLAQSLALAGSAAATALIERERAIEQLVQQAELA